MSMDRDRSAPRAYCVRVPATVIIGAQWGDVGLADVTGRGNGKLQCAWTRRGMGPWCADKAARRGIRDQDLLDLKILRQKIEVARAEKNVWLERVYGTPPLDLEEIAERYE